jgi:hypothetical protein
MLNHKEPSFLAENQSVASLVAQLHNYFKNNYSHFKMERSAVLSRLDAAEGEAEQELLKELRKIDTELSLFGSLSDALSIADRLLHARSVMNELGLNSEVYMVHHKESEKSS